MTTSVEPMLLGSSQMAESAQVLARAFYDDPLMQYIEPDDGRRRTMLPWFMGCGVSLAHQFGQIYLETMKTRNVPFYRKHGFEVVVEDDLPGGGLHFWTMRREPR